MKRYFEKFGKHLKDCRKAAGLSQIEVARALRCRSTIHLNMGARDCLAPVRVLYKIAKLYSVAVEDLYDLLMQDSLKRTRLQLEDEIRKLAKAN